MTTTEYKITVPSAEQLMHCSPDGIITFDCEFRYTSWNPVMETLTGIAAEEVLGKVAFKQFPFLTEVGQDQYFVSALEGKAGAAPIRKFHIPSTDRCVYVESRFAPLKDKTGEIIGGMAVVRDVSERAQREANDQMFQSIADSIPHMVWITNEKDEVSYFSQAWYDYTGAAREMFKASDSIDFVHPEDREALIEIAQKSYSRGEPFDLDYRLRGEAGNYRWFHVRGISIKGPDGVVLRRLGTGTDIHEQKLAMQNAAEAHEQFRALLDQTPFSFQLYSLSGFCVYANSAWENIWQTSRDQLEGYNIFEDPHLELSGVTQLVLTAFSGESVTLPDVYFDPARLGKIGRPRWIRPHFSPIRDGLGKLSQIALVAEDVTTHVDNQARDSFLSAAGKVLGSTLEVDQILSNIAELCVSKLADICTIDLVEYDGSLRRVKVAGANSELQAMIPAIMNLSPATLFTEHPAIRALKSLETVFIPHLDTKWAERMPLAPEHRELITTCEPSSLIACPLVVRGKAVGVLSLIHTKRNDRKFTEGEIALVEELAERLEIAIDNSKLYQESKQAVVARDTFLSVASHELKTPLTTLQLQLKLIQRLSDESKVYAELSRKLVPVVEETQHGIRRISRLVDDMLDISKIASGQLKILPESLDLSALTEEVCDRLRPMSSDYECRLEFKNEGPVYGEWDGLRIEQVLTNLIFNAFRYGQKSTVKVSAWKTDSCALFSVSDSGRGIARVDHERIFRRFERAVSQYEVAGFGLGLFIANRIVRLHDGSITVESEPGAGSTFTVSLPKSAE